MDEEDFLGNLESDDSNFEADQTNDDYSESSSE